MRFVLLSGETVAARDYSGLITHIRLDNVFARDMTNEKWMVDVMPMLRGRLPGRHLPDSITASPERFLRLYVEAGMGHLILHNGWIEATTTTLQPMPAGGMTAVPKPKSLSAAFGSFGATSTPPKPCPTCGVRPMIWTYIPPFPQWQRGRDGWTAETITGETYRIRQGTVGWLVEVGYDQQYSRIGTAPTPEEVTEIARVHYLSGGKGK
jgi:hypothetical protein